MNSVRKFLFENILILFKTWIIGRIIVNTLYKILYTQLNGNLIIVELRRPITFVSGGLNFDLLTMKKRKVYIFFKVKAGGITWDRVLILLVYMVSMYIRESFIHFSNRETQWSGYIQLLDPYYFLLLQIHKLFAPRIPSFHRKSDLRSR